MTMPLFLVPDWACPVSLLLCDQQTGELKYPGSRVHFRGCGFSSVGNRARRKSSLNLGSDSQPCRKSASPIRLIQLSRLLFGLKFEKRDSS
jgi:hypothetical protein